MSLISKLTYLNENGKETKVNEPTLDLHGSLTENTDWNSDYWEFERDRLPSLSNTIQEHFNRSNYGITFQAIWAGDNVKSTISLSINEFINVILQNRISTKFKYIVRKSA